MDEKIRIEGKRCFVDNIEVFTANSNIKSVLVIEDVFIVLVDPFDNGVKNNRNIFAYNSTGDLLWQIEEVNFVHANVEYTGIYKVVNGVALYNRSGVEVVVDPVTGRILSKELIK